MRMALGEPISLRLQPDLQDYLEKEAASERRPLGAYIRNILHDQMTLRKEMESYVKTFSPVKTDD